MNKICLSLIFVLGFFSFTSAQLVISEIMYNPPESGNDSLEYIEIYNTSDAGINLNGYNFSQGVEYTFGDTTIAANGYVVVAINSGAMHNIFGFNPLQWSSGALSNGGEDIILVDSDDSEIDIVDYSPDNPWPTFAEGASGGGASIEFCMDQEDNNLAENWRASSAETGIVINALSLRGSPGVANSASCGFITTPVDTIRMSGVSFTPKDITINKGETLLWVNESGMHNVNASLETYPDNPEGFLSGVPAPAPFEFEYTFTKEGTYDYQCDLHVGSGMTGTVTVLDVTPILVITEIMYNDPSSDDVDSLEFIEVYNAGTLDANLGGIKLVSNVINFTLPDSILPAGEFVILQKQYSGFIASQNVMFIPWISGGLGNNSDHISLKMASDEVIDFVSYSDSDPWDTQADGLGKSLSLCNLNADNNNPENWQGSSSPTYVVFDGDIVVFANPGSFNSCILSIADATSIDSNGVAVNLNSSVTLQGLAYGPNFKSSGLQFSLIDNLNEGVAVFSDTEDFGYSIKDGDELKLTGEIRQFNGLTRLYLSALELESSENALIDPRMISDLGEDDESSLVQMENVSLVDPEQWTGSGSGFNVDVTNGEVLISLRIDAEVLDLYEGEYPTGSFMVTGIGGQYDESEPYTDGYQLYPRGAMDIDPYIPFTNEYPFKTIGEVSQNNEDGTAVSDGLNYEIQGVTHGINMRPSGLQFTVIDESNDGVGVFFNTGNLGYDYQEGDLLSIKGSISQFNGLTQMNPDSIGLISSGNALQNATDVSTLGEETESQLVKVSNVTIIDPGEWSGDGSSFNVDIMTEGGETLSMRIDADVELSTMPLPGNNLNVTGIGGQFDSQSPYDDGYQILPRYSSDIEISSGLNDPFLDEELVNIYPNPSKDHIRIESSLIINNITIYNQLGMLVKSIKHNIELINIRDLNKGFYIIHFENEKGIIQKELIKL